ncbi:Putative S-locus receptor-like protein kinase family protein [Zea mays]|uniref:non-specific serine/threonine protein kinase n=1 Tax=Zea mays TaxID=4577 RepID=A0A1D6ITR4_MAIZE|nr:Putative S-locus receptor-like protein kinase family protein [Zea mays]
MAPPSSLTAALLIHLLRGGSDLASVAATHAKLVKAGIATPLSSSNHLLAAYCRYGAIGCARDLFDGMRDRDVVSWTTLMSGYAAAARPRDAVSLLRAMGCSGVRPNAVTFSTAACACARLADAELGRQVHAQVEIAGCARDTVVATALVDMYGKSGGVEDARAVFDAMAAPARNAVSWGAMLAVYAQNALGNEAVELFAELRTCGGGMAPNHFMLASVVSACAGMARLGIGRCVHGAVLRLGYGNNDVISVALVDMYSKCGRYEYSRKVFDRIKQPSVVTYTSIIVAAAKYGRWTCALTLFNEMLLRSMQSRYGVAPCPSHYTSAVDMLGRAGRLEEAFELAKEAQLEGNDALLLWNSLLSACRTHKRLDLATMAGQRVYEFNNQQDVAAGLVVMSNAYISAVVPNGMTIRVMKNLRMCSDCHEVFKFISAIVESEFVVILLGLLSLHAPSNSATATDTVYPGNGLAGSSSKLVSNNSKFALGFFRMDNKSFNYATNPYTYLGIWFNKVPKLTPLWSANGESPVMDPASPELAIAGDGNLVILDQATRSVIWSTHAKTTTNDTVAVLQNNGNLVLRSSSNSSTVFWQSFDYPTDTFFAGAKIGWDKVTGLNRRLVSRKNLIDQAPGLYTGEIQKNGVGHLVWNSTVEIESTGLWNGQYFSSAPEMIGNTDNITTFEYVNNDKEVYFTWNLHDETAIVLSQLGVDGQGMGRRLLCLAWQIDQCEEATT